MISNKHLHIVASKMAVDCTHQVLSEWPDNAQAMIILLAYRDQFDAVLRELEAKASPPQCTTQKSVPRKFAVIDGDVR